MLQYLESTEAQVVIWLAVLASLVLVAVYVVRKVREGITEDAPVGSDIMSNFRELHAQGELSDEEYREIKPRLAGRLQDELKRSEDKG